MKKEGIAFRFYVGRSKRNVFEPKLTPDTEKNKWVPVMSVGDREGIELKFTGSSWALSGELPADQTNTISISISQPEQKDCTVFVRSTSATTFDVGIAKTESEIGESIEHMELE